MTPPTKQPRKLAAGRNFKRQPIIWTVVVLFSMCSYYQGSKNGPSRDATTNEQQPSERVLHVQEEPKLHHPTATLIAASLLESDSHTTAVASETVKAGSFNASNQEQLLSLVGNDIDEFFDKNDPATHRAGTHRPVVLRGFWKPPNEDWKSKESFLKAYGHIPYYIKDHLVQVKDERCIAQFKDLWNFITSPSSTDSVQSDKMKSRRSLLAFTNDKENIALFGEQGEKLPFDIPTVVQHIDSFTILSTMTKGQSHEFHKHGESWIAQAVGHKVWWFLPPTAKRPPKVNACDYLNGKQTPPPGVVTTLQSPGDVIWFPYDYYHATCSLTDWNVGIGRQLGPRINQNFKTLPETLPSSNQKTVQYRLKKCSGETS